MDGRKIRYVDQEEGEILDGTASFDLTMKNFTVELEEKDEPLQCKTSEARGIRATRGVDQGCPLSPVFFATLLAAPLEQLQQTLQARDPRARVLSYLDDIYVVVQPDLVAATVASAQDLFAVVASGAVEIPVHARSALADVGDVHRALEGRRTTGATVLTP